MFWRACHLPLLLSEVNWVHAFVLCSFKIGIFHSVFCLTKCPYRLPKRVRHRVTSSVFSFIFQYSLFLLYILISYFNYITVNHQKIQMYHHRQQNSRLLTNFDVGVNGIPLDLKLMYTTCNQHFKFCVASAYDGQNDQNLLPLMEWKTLCSTEYIYILLLYFVWFVCVIRKNSNVAILNTLLRNAILGMQASWH